MIYHIHYWIHVRLWVHFTCITVLIFFSDGKMLVSLEENMIYQHGDEFAQHLARGLADNWSQVCSNCCPVFLLVIHIYYKATFNDYVVLC